MDTKTVRHDNYQCPMVSFVELIAGKWAIPVLYRLIVNDEPLRFSALKKAIHPISQKELTRQLKNFEDNGLVTRTVYAEVPPKVEYQITPLGNTLRPALDLLADWIKSHGHELGESHGE